MEEGDLHIVTLVWVVGGNVISSLCCVRGEWRSGSEDHSSLRPRNCLLERTFRLRQRIAEGEQDRSAAKSTGINGGFRGREDCLVEAAEVGVRPMSAVGFTYSITSSRVANWWPL